MDFRSRGKVGRQTGRGGGAVKARRRREATREAASRELKCENANPLCRASVCFDCSGLLQKHGSATWRPLCNGIAPYVDI